MDGDPNAGLPGLDADWQFMPLGGGGSGLSMAMARRCERDTKNHRGRREAGDTIDHAGSISEIFHLTLIKIKWNILFQNPLVAYVPQANAPRPAHGVFMQLSKFSDYALRVLLLAASTPDRNTTIREAAEIYGISHAHLKKVVLHLSRQGYLAAERGHGGGFRLGMPSDQINLGMLIRSTETDFALVECYRPNTRCCIAPTCLLPGILNEALAAFMEVLDRHTLQDIALRPEAFPFQD